MKVDRSMSLDRESAFIIRAMLSRFVMTFHPAPPLYEHWTPSYDCRVCNLKTK